MAIAPERDNYKALQEWASLFEDCLFEFLNSLIEGRSNLNDHVIKSLSENIDFDQMIANLHEHFVQS